jgi:ATP-binding cassette subfamily B protein
VADKTVSAESGTLKTLRNLWPYMYPSDRPDLRWRVTWATLLLIVAKLVLVAGPYFFKWATDALAGTGKYSPPLPAILTGAVALVIAYNFLRLAQLGFNQLRDALFARVGQHAVRQLAWRTFVHMHELSLRFHLERRTGGLSRIIERGTKGIETIVRFIMLNTAPTVLEFALTAGIFAFTYGWRYVAVVALTVAIYVWFTVKASDWRIGIRRDMNDSDTDANTKAIDSLLNFETVKYFGNEAMEAERFDRSMARYEIAATRIWTSLGWLNFGQGAIFGLGTTIVMVMSALEVKAGTQTVGDFVFINAMLIQLSVPLNFIGFIYREIRQGLTDIEQMFDLLDVRQEVTDKPGARPLAIEAGRVEFRDVHFAYDANRPILKGISFTVPAGKTVAIVGPSGAGKTTVFQLLLRFYDPDAGRVSFDGVDLKDLAPEKLRRHIGLVAQDPVIFSTSALENIRYGRPEATIEEIEAAARAAHADEFLDLLPQGYDTFLGERGVRLSGGQRQRIAIARAILRNPALLLLDEATSALDAESERVVQKALDEVMQDRTTIVIAHRLATVLKCDRILVMDHGRVDAIGTHAELARQGGLYARLAALQFDRAAE